MFERSYKKAIKAAFPELNIKFPSSTAPASSSYWNSAEKRREFFIDLAKRNCLDASNPASWNFTLAQIHATEVTNFFVLDP